MAEPPVRPDVRAYLDQVAADPPPPFTAEVLAQIRLLPPEAIAWMDLPLGELGAVEDRSMPGAGGDIELRLFDPRAQRDPGPVVVFYHGGGFVLGSIGTHAGLAAEIARRLDLPVVSVGYRLAPEHPWPAGVDDAEAAARWIAQNGPSFGRTFTDLILCGDSAGGNLAIVTGLALRAEPAALPVLLQVLIYPITDADRNVGSRVAYADGYALSSLDLDLFEQHYAADPTSWRRSPLQADQADMPPTLLVTASHDPLRDEGRAYAAKLIAAGVPTTYREVRGTIHGFASYRGVMPSAQADLHAALKLAKTMIAELVDDPAA